MLAKEFPVSVCLNVASTQLPQRVAVAAHFVCAEALANVAKHAAAARVAVAVTASDGRVRIEIADDGVGGADPARGSGLRGLADRVGAVDGQLTISSPSGGPTVIRAELPCES